jgi:hypothetical protein
MGLVEQVGIVLPRDGIGMGDRPLHDAVGQPVVWLPSCLRVIELKQPVGVVLNLLNRRLIEQPRADQSLPHVLGQDDMVLARVHIPVSLRLVAKFLHRPNQFALDGVRLPTLWHIGSPKSARLFLVPHEA